ncbi:MAG: GNAT family N-acetyltransferase [Clostridiales bacterium]|nr:GNAT family N-acetyltransferase [uncultured Anaerosporobacter sp.]MBS5933326.1 GNAT family N-acetyltransferase [Clostridiales bacterium]
MNIIIELGNEKDIDELEKLYDDLNDYLAAGINYPGWLKGVYPIREDAVKGIEEGYLYVARYNDEIVGSIILNHEPEDAYNQANWEIEADYSDIVVIHTFAVHPKFMKNGIGQKLMEFATSHSKEIKAKAIRLDVFEKNVPAIKLYEKHGYRYIDTVDLGYGEYGLDWFKLYEKVL